MTVLLELTDEQIEQVWDLVCWRYQSLVDSNPVEVLRDRYQGNKKLYMEEMAVFFGLCFCHACGRAKGVEIRHCTCAVEIVS